MDVVITADDYAVRKVYSIWICMEEGRDANTIREYRIRPRDIHGRYSGRERYDLLSVVMVRLPRNEDASAGNMLHKLLTTLLSSGMTPEGKDGIPMSYELKEATAKLCNLSDLVEERGIEKGLERGTELKLIRQVLKKLKKSYNVTQIAEALEETEDKISRIVESVQKYAPEYDEKKILDEVMRTVEV